MSIQEIQVALLGLGNVGQAFARYVGTTGRRDSPKLTIRAVADSSSGLVLNSYEDIDRILTFKQQGHPTLHCNRCKPTVRLSYI
jgi:homoserine dehydrogenase